LDIIPTPGLHKGFDIDAFITSDLTSIFVDEFVYDSRPGRYRFSLAHELAHLLLHKDIFSRLRFSTIAEWKKVITEFPEKEYGYLEWQAYALAGLILVPPDPLAGEFEKAVAHLYQVGLSLETATEPARCMIEGALAEYFAVSTAVIGKRVGYDNLWQRK
jgi:Zn-dependent peptidase ImmA (M78 family)